jgi:hypothetical protein
MVNVKLVEALVGNMLKRYEYWAFEDGKAVKKWTNYFPWDSTLTDPIQLKGYKGNHLRNEYKVLS